MEETDVERLLIPPGEEDEGKKEGEKP